jgi:hypothetical protein
MHIDAIYSECPFLLSDKHWHLPINSVFLSEMIEKMERCQTQMSYVPCMQSCSLETVSDVSDIRLTIEAMKRKD